MDFYFSTQAQKKIKLSIQMGKKRQGFLIGEVLGESVIINDIYHQNFINDIDQVYPIMLQSFHNSLLGAFFTNHPAFLNEWFLGDIILEINKEIGIFFELNLDIEGNIEKRKIKEINLGEF